MSGKIKTGASTWSSVSSLRVKTAQGWRQAAKGYVKTDANTWSEWFEAPVIDTFTRSDSSSFLTPADSGHTWTGFSPGVWYPNGSQAQSNDSPGSYPIAGVDYPNTEASVSATPSPGTGVTVISANGDWYAAVLYEDQINTSVPCNCRCTGHDECSPNPCYGYGCPPCGTTAGSTTTTYTATQTESGGYWRYGFTADGPYYTCSSGNVSGSLCYSCSNYPYYLWTGSNCKSLFGEYYQSATYVGPATRYYTCPAGYETGHSNVNSCYYWQPTYTYTCNAGDGSPSGTTCYHTEPTSVCNSPCVTGYGCGCTPYHVSGGTWPNCDGYGTTCDSCGGYATRYFLRLLRSVSGNVTIVQTDISLSSAPSKIRLETHGSQIIYKAYSDTAMTSELGSGTYTIPDIPTPFIYKYRGIVKSPSAYAQGSTIDDFSVFG